MTIKILEPTFAIYKIKEISSIDFTQEYIFLSKTEEEISLVCPENITVKNITDCDKNWRAFRIQGELDFSLIGILSKISTILAKNNIGIFAISTYNTDYIFTKAYDFDSAIQLLELAGYKLIR